MSGVISRKDVTDKLAPGSIGGTYAGNAVACAAAVAVADVMREDKILENVQTRSVQLFTALNDLKADPTLAHVILDVRGRGLMVAVEFASPAGVGAQFGASDSHDKPIPTNLASRVAKRCIEKGMLILTTSVYEVVRFIPPLNITQEDMAKGCQIFGEALKEVVKEG